MGQPSLRLDDDTWLLVLTGAGVSAESGVPTFRGGGGLWESHRVEDVASPEGFRKDPRLVWRFYSQRRARGRACAPNPGHLALVEAEERLRDRFLLVTQNVDGLHRRAGTRRLIEIHGCLFESRCFQCDREPFPDEAVYEGPDLPACERCRERGESGLIRPNVVWFGELLDPTHLERIGHFMQGAAGRRLVFLAAGTSGAVYPAAGLVLSARSAGAETWLVNAEPADNTAAFDHFVKGPSGEVLPRLLGGVK